MKERLSPKNWSLVSEFIKSWINFYLITQSFSLSCLTFPLSHSISYQCFHICPKTWIRKLFSVVQSRLAETILQKWIHITVQTLCQQMYVTTLYCHHHRRHTWFCLCILIDICVFHEYFENFYIASPAGIVECCPTNSINCINVGVWFENCFDYFCSA